METLLVIAMADLARSHTDQAGQRRCEASALAKQQAALRRVATLVARGVPESQLFCAVARELAGCLGMRYAIIARYETDGQSVVIAARNDPGLTTMPVGVRFSPHTRPSTTIGAPTERRTPISRTRATSAPVALS